MARINALASLISILHKDSAATIEALTEAYTSDFSHFAKHNNDDSLVSAVKSLTKSPADKAIASAMVEGRKASGLVVGRIGATGSEKGKFEELPETTQQKYIDAITSASEAFKVSIEASGAFADKAPKTEEEKAKAKAEKAEKAEKAVNDLITAKVQAGELVRASEVHTIKDMSSQCLATELASREDLNTVLIGDLRTIGGFEGLHAAHEALLAEYATLKADYATLKASKASKAKATA